MNSLEPWKIWAVTGVLVCAILGSTAARVHPQIFGEASARAATLTSAEQSPTVAATTADTAGDSCEAYPSYTPRSFFSAGYSGIQVGAIVPLSSLLYGSGSISTTQKEEDQEPIVDVTKEIFGTQNSEPNLAATTSWQPNPLNYLAIPDTAESELQNEMFADVSQDHWAYAAVSDTDPTITIATSVREPSDLYFTDLSGTNEGRIIDLAIQNTLVNTAVTGLVANGTVDLTQLLPTGFGSSDDQAIELGKQAVVASALQNLAMSGELDKELGDELDGIDDTKLQSGRVEEESLVLAEAQSQLQAAEQQRVQAVYTATLGRINLQMNGVQFTVQPQE